MRRYILRKFLGFEEPPLYGWWTYSPTGERYLTFFSSTTNRRMIGK